MTTLAPHDLVLSAGSALHIPLPERLRLAREAGFAGVSMWPADYQAAAASGLSAADIADRIAGAGLVLTEFECICSWVPGLAPKAISGFPPDFVEVLQNSTAERLCPLASALDARAVTLADLFHPGAPVELLAEGLAQACDIAADHGLDAILEFVPTGGVPDLLTALEVIRLANRPNAKLLVDSWHFFRSDSRLEDLAKVPGDLITAIQINDAPAAPEPDLNIAMSSARLLPGEGEFDLTGFMSSLRATGSRAPVSVEVISKAYLALPHDEAIRRCVETTRRYVPDVRS